MQDNGEGLRELLFGGAGGSQAAALAEQERLRFMAQAQANRSQRMAMAAALRGQAAPSGPPPAGLPPGQSTVPFPPPAPPALPPASPPPPVAAPSPPLAAAPPLIGGQPIPQELIGDYNSYVPALGKARADQAIAERRRQIDISTGLRGK